MNKYLLEARNICKSFSFQGEKISILKDISLNINYSSRVGLFGPSGSGKSTLCYILGLLDNADFGELFIDGVNVLKLNKIEKANFIALKIGFIYQSPFLLSDLTVFENIILSAKIANIANAKTEVEKLIELLNIKDIYKKYPEMLSGGQKQRVSIARACVKNPLIIFADEPISNLDIKNANIVLTLLFDTIKHFKSSLFMVTHNLLLQNQFDACYQIEDHKILKI